MSNRCSLTGKGVMSGNNVSHAHNKTRRRFYPNLQQASLFSAALNSVVRLKVSRDTIRTVEKRGGIDKFLLDLPDSSLTKEIRRLKARIKKRIKAKSN